MRLVASSKKGGWGKFPSPLRVNKTRLSSDLVIVNVKKENTIVTPKNIEQIFVYKDPKLAHTVNQVSIITLQNSEVLMGFNEERYPRHADSGQSCFIKSKDGGKT